MAQLLRQLSEFYSREASHLFVTRIAQGLNHMGKVCFFNVAEEGRVYCIRTEKTILFSLFFFLLEL